MKKFIITFLLILSPIEVYAFGSVNPATMNQYRYYQTRPCWNRAKVQRPCIYSEQQARYYGYRTFGNNIYNQQNRQFNSGYYGYGNISR